MKQLPEILYKIMDVLGQLIETHPNKKELYKQLSDVEYYIGLLRIKDDNDAS